MIKTVTLLRRRPDLTREEFDRHWRTVHAPLVLALPGVVAYVQGRVLGDVLDTDVDGIAEVWYRSEKDMRATFATPEYAALLSDEANFMGPTTGESVFVAVEERRLR